MGEVFTSTAAVRPRSTRPGSDGVDEAEPATGGLTFAPRVPPLLVSTTPGRLLIVSRGWQDGHPLTHEVQAVYAVTGGRLVLQAWQERDL
jgi:hypothetical protein